jgi:Flp pilus assembly protein TadD
MAYGDALPHLERAAELRPDDPQVWLDLATYYERKLIFEQSWEARRRAESLAAGRSISQDERSGFWVVEGESIYP